MDEIADLRVQIYDYFQNSRKCQRYFHAASKRNEYAAYYNSMYLLQDATESLSFHRKRGFSESPMLAYIEFWGVMQAVIVQQDAIRQLNELVTGKDLKPGEKSKWLEIRRLRDIVAGHPAEKSRRESAPIRAFIGRNFGGYEKITFEQWQEGIGVTHPEIALGNSLDAYAVEARSYLYEIFQKIKEKW